MTSLANELLQMCISFFILLSKTQYRAAPSSLIRFVSSLHRRQLVSTEPCSENAVSYGVRNSIAAYLSFSGNQNPAQTRAQSRKKKSKSLYALPENAIENIDYEDDF